MNRITVAQHDHVWWLVDSAGRRFVSLGINHLQPDCWLAPYNREATLARYGADLEADDGGFNPHGTALKRLVDASLARMRDWGFNTLGMHTHGVPAALFRDQCCYAVCLDAVHLGSRFRFGADRFPDVFDEPFASTVLNRAIAVCGEHRDSRNLIGYAFSDIPRWYFYPGQHQMLALPIHPWVADLRSLPYHAPGKNAWIECLQERYGDAGQAATVHGVAAKTWDELRRRTDWPRPADPERARGDGDALLARAAERWYEVHARAIRQVDRHHLLLGDKLHSPHAIPSWLIDIVRRHVDIVFIQCYLPFADQRDGLIALHQRTAKLILNGDGSFACPKPPHQTRVKGHLVPSIEAVGQAYFEYLEGIMSLPFMLGWHHCGFMEQWDGGKRSAHGELNENGLMDPFERPYDVVVDRVRAANRRAHAWHEAASLAAGT